MNLHKYQQDAVDKLQDGNILVGGVGSGKSRTALAYFIKEHKDKQLYIITTARKRDTKEWEKEYTMFNLKNIIVDSWNNIKKYKNIKNSFFIFDEQRVIGNGTWVKSFLKIADNNYWVLLSATPGDTWSDYIPVFIANGYYKTRSEFVRRHVIFNHYSKFPKVDRYIEVSRLIKIRDSIIVQMKYLKKTISNNKMIKIGYDKEKYATVEKKRWNPYKKEPIQNITQLCYLMRKVVNSDSRRIYTIEQLMITHPKIIVFYNFDYERDLLLDFGKRKKIPITEWNGHNHQEISKTDTWIYIVQYAAGAEGWNCIETDTIIFYSQNYSYKATIQAAGRIDRLNTKFKDLYYYYLYSTSSIDLAIRKAFDEKRDFNEKSFA